MESQGLVPAASWLPGVASLTTDLWANDFWETGLWVTDYLVTDFLDQSFGRGSAFHHKVV